MSEEEAGRSTNLKINESFLGFIEITDETGLCLEEEILNSSWGERILYVLYRGIKGINGIK